MFRATVLLAVSLPLCVACNQAPIDGGWSGTAECEQGDDLDVEAILDQELETSTVEGIVFIDYNIDFGILGVLQVTSRTEVDDGEWDGQDGTIEGELIPDDTGDGDPAPRWRFNLELNDDFDELTGNLDRINNDGETVNECDVELDKFHDPSN